MRVISKDPEWPLTRFSSCGTFQKQVSENGTFYIVQLQHSHPVQCAADARSLCDSWASCLNSFSFFDGN